MEKMVLRIFQKEIERQCKFAIIAIDEIKSGLANNNSDIIFWNDKNRLEGLRYDLAHTFDIKTNNIEVNIDF